MKRLWRWLVAAISQLIDAVVEAREGAKPTPVPTLEEAKAGAPIPVVLPADDPLVIARSTGGAANPLPLSHIPIRSTKADAKRAAHAYAEQRAGRPLTWKRARQLLNAWEREERLAAIDGSAELKRLGASAS